MTKRKLWHKPIHARRRPTRAYTPAEMTFIEAERMRQPPTSWERIGKALDRHPMSVQDKWYRMQMQKKDHDREAPPISAKKLWPAWARFRTPAMKATPEPRYVPHGCPRFAREMALIIQSPATTNTLRPPGRGREPVASSPPSGAAGSHSEART